VARALQEVPLRCSEWLALYKSHNAELTYWGGSLRASLQGVIHGVMLLGKGGTIACEACLVANLLQTC